MLDLDLLKKIPLFEGLKGEDLESVRTICQLKHYEHNKMIVHEEDPAGSFLYIVFKGRVKVTLNNEEGKETILAMLGSGDFFGEISIFDEGPRSATVTAMIDSELILIRKEDLLAELKHYPDMMFRILVGMSRRLRKADQQIVNLAWMDVYGRVARILLQLADEQGVPNGKFVEIEKRPTHQELASMTGTSRETVTRVLNDLERQNYLFCDHRRFLIDRKQLETKTQE